MSTIVHIRGKRAAGQKNRKGPAETKAGPLRFSVGRVSILRVIGQDKPAPCFRHLIKTVGVRIQLRQMDRAAFLHGAVNVIVIFSVKIDAVEMGITA